MIASGDVRLLMQYINSLEEAMVQLEEMYLNKNLEEANKIKTFMLDLKSKINDILVR